MTAQLEWNEDFDACGTSLLAYLQSPWSFEETIARLITVSGQTPTAMSDGYKTSVEFVGKFKGEIFTLYDYKGDRTIHIGSGGGVNAAQLQAALVKAMSAVRPSPYRAEEHYDESAGQVHQYGG